MDSFDLATGMFRQSVGNDTSISQAVNFENALIGSDDGPITLMGTSGPNVLRATTGYARGVAVYGLAGHDILRGSEQRDTLIGGLGHDTVNRSRGNDRCEGEVRVGCER
jgi:Ca2+-binding RTX toxin-like protein